MVVLNHNFIKSNKHLSFRQILYALAPLTLTRITISFYKVVASRKPCTTLHAKNFKLIYRIRVYFFGGAAWWLLQAGKVVFVLCTLHLSPSLTVWSILESTTILSCTGVDIGDGQKRSKTGAPRQDKSSSSVAMVMTDTDTSANLPAPPTTTEVKMTDDVCYAITKSPFPQHLRDCSRPVDLLRSPRHVVIPMSKNVAYGAVSARPKISESNLMDNVCYGMGPARAMKPE